MIYPGSEIDSTNTGSFNRSREVVFIASPCLLNGGLGTSAALSVKSSANIENYRLHESINTSSGSCSIQSQEINSHSLFEFRRISGLTWDKIAEIFGVTRRAVHFWANGKPMEDYRAEKLYYLIMAVRILDTGYPVQNRRLLLAQGESSVSLFDLFKKGDFYSAHLRMTPVTVSTAYNLKPLSSQALAELEPTVSPFDLLNANNSRIKAKKTKVSVALVRKVKRES